MIEQTQTQKQFLYFLVVLAVLWLVTSCGGVIPKGYQGQFQDSNAGITLELKSNEGTLSEAGGKMITAKGAELEFPALLAGAPGLYGRPNPANANYVDVFWIQPTSSTQSNGGGLSWYSAEVLMSVLNAKQKEKVYRFEIVHCVDGQVLLDTVNQAWQAGCPAHAKRYELQRVGE